MRDALQVVLGPWLNRLEALSGSAGPSADSAAFFRALLCLGEAPGSETALGELFSQAVPIVRDEWERSPLSLVDKEPLWPQVGALREPALREGHEQAFRRQRTVEIESLVDDPICDPMTEILWTTNVLLTVPHDDELHDVSPEVAEVARATRDCSQEHFYDHPIPIGTAKPHNEIVYGLRHLEAAFAEEAHAAPPQKALVLLSVSVTHSGLEPIARQYIADLLREEHFPHLELWIATERECARLAGVLGEAAAALRVDWDEGAFARVFGVEGPYARHYTLLRAIAPLIQACCRPALKATFKFDLDQVFLPDVTRREMGKTPFDQLKTRQWGACARDHNGERLVLGGISGRLVNIDDAEHSLWIPDVDYLDDARLSAPERVFYPRGAQALSTHVEMMTRNDVLERFHVTGGMTGYRIDALRRFRPFAPSWVGRAEDQSFALPTMTDSPRMATLHAPGLVMRHDKSHRFTAAIAMAAAGKWVGDLQRILVFTRLIEALPRDPDALRQQLGPFTGAFVATAPVTLVFWRLACRLLEEGDSAAATELSVAACRQLGPAMSWLGHDARATRDRLAVERRAWRGYYDLLDRWDGSQWPQKAEAELVAWSLYTA